MPNIKIVNLGKTIRVGLNANLRQALLHHKASPYKGIAKYVNCHGLGTCGTCAVKILRGEVSPPHLGETLRGYGKEERLSCQTRVMGDLEIDTLVDPPASDAADATAETDEKEAAGV